jgi:hypothetical protein
LSVVVLVAPLQFQTLPMKKNEIRYDILEMPNDGDYVFHDKEGNVTTVATPEIDTDSQVRDVDKGKMGQMINSCQIQWSCHLAKVAKGELVERDGGQEKVDACKAQDKVFKVISVDELGFTKDQETEEADRIQQFKSCIGAHAFYGN